MKKRINWKVLIISILIVYLIAFIGSIFTSKSVGSAWYESIKPSITPPNWVFPVVWNILFFLIALSLYFCWIKSDNFDKKKIIFVFGLNFVINISWSYLYFGIRSPLSAFYALILLWISILIMIKVTWKIDKISGLLLFPYLLWVSFAGVLNYLSAFS